MSRCGGPFARWRHEHRFSPEGEGRTVVEDIVEWEAPLGSFGNSFSEAYIRSSLKRLFAFRARRLAGDLAAHRLHGQGQGKVIAVTGSGGMIGRALVSLLTTGGYRVLKVVRSTPSADDEIQWDPERGVLPSEPLEGIHGVVHLAGESIAGVRWTEAKKKSILRSREDGTRLLASTLARLSSPPGVFVSASGSHYYGDRGDERLSEESGPGSGFLADVCRRWEAATGAAESAGIRTVKLRTGPVLSPSGGVLGTMLLPFRTGLGGRLGSGRQYFPWIDLDDHTYLILHALVNDQVTGPMNATSPSPLSNAAFTDALGRVLNRPTLLPVPALAIRGILGEMGRELLLSGQRAFPERALRTGFQFRCEGVEESLRHQLGRTEDDTTISPSVS
jgi:uncharacterized protein